MGFLCGGRSAIDDASSFAVSRTVVDDLNQRLFGGQTGTIAVMDISAESPCHRLLGCPGNRFGAGCFARSPDRSSFCGGSWRSRRIRYRWRASQPSFGSGGDLYGHAASPLPSGDGQDYNGDDRLDAVDLDAMVRAIAGGQNPLDFDMSGDGRVNSLDRDAGLNAAAAENVPAGMAYVSETPTWMASWTGSILKRGT